MKFQAFFGGFHPSENKTHLEQFVQNLGYYPLSIKMASEIATSEKCPKNYCIIEFANDVEFRDFLTKQNFYFKGRCLHAKPFFKGKSLKKQKSRNKDFKFFIKNIPLLWDHNDLSRFLNQAIGGVNEACVITEPFSGNSKGIGYAIFDSSVQNQNELKNLRIFKKLFINFNFGFLEIESYGAGKKKSNQEAAPIPVSFQTSGSLEPISPTDKEPKKNLTKKNKVSS